jgi:hypothetical protein
LQLHPNLKIILTEDTNRLSRLIPDLIKLKTRKQSLKALQKVHFKILKRMSTNK